MTSFSGWYCESLRWTIGDLAGWGMILIKVQNEGMIYHEDTNSRRKSIVKAPGTGYCQKADLVERSGFRTSVLSVFVASW